MNLSRRAGAEAGASAEDVAGYEAGAGGGAGAEAGAEVGVEDEAGASRAPGSLAGLREVGGWG